MEQRLDLDYCLQCDFPVFNHEEVVLIQGEYVHRHCFDGSKWVAKRRDLKSYPFKTN